MNFTEQEKLKMLMTLMGISGVRSQTAMAQVDARTGQPARCPPGDPRDPNMDKRTRQAWMQYLRGFDLPMAQGFAPTGPVTPPKYLDDQCFTPGVGHAAEGQKVPIPFSKTIAAVSVDTITIRPNQPGIPVGLDMTRSGDNIVVTNIQNYNNAPLYDQGEGDIAVAYIANIDFNQQSFESSVNPFPANADRINRTYPLTIDVANGNAVDPEVAGGTLWLRVG